MSNMSDGRIIEIFKIGSISRSIDYNTVMVNMDVPIHIKEYLDYFMDWSEGYTNWKVYKTTLSLGDKQREITTLKFKKNKIPVIGESYYPDGWSWGTSMVDNIIYDGNIVITRNSVYAIHDPIDTRNRKLHKLGI